MIARTYYDEPTTTGWLAGWRWFHVEGSPLHLHLRLGYWTLTINRADDLSRVEWEERR